MMQTKPIFSKRFSGTPGASACGRTCPARITTSSPPSVIRGIRPLPCAARTSTSCRPSHWLSDRLRNLVESQLRPSPRFVEQGNLPKPDVLEILFAKTRDQVVDQQRLRDDDPGRRARRQIREPLGFAAQFLAVSRVKYRTDTRVPCGRQVVSQLVCAVPIQ